jgi:flavin reductase (DIM6/NTAB) family NADH-FMN oxidoreductase RutF
MSFKQIDIETLKFNPFTKIGKEAFLITAGTPEKFNTMTASWGFMGVMWGKNCIEAVIRPTRLTYDFAEKSELFTVSFLPEEMKDVITYCGTHSGRDVDKCAETGLIPVNLDGAVTFEQANLVLVCKKIYRGNMDPDGLAEEYRKFNEKDPLHVQFIGEILSAYRAMI